MGRDGNAYVEPLRWWEWLHSIYLDHVDWHIRARAAQRRWRKAKGND